MPAYVLGINDGHNASACLLRDGRIVACASEERFTRRKNHSGFPRLAANYCLSQQRVSIRDVELVVISTVTMVWGYAVPHSRLKSFAVDSSFRVWSEVARMGGPSALTDNLSEYAARKTDAFRLKRASLELGCDTRKVAFVDHHLAHAYTALYCSPFPSEGGDALVLTNDAMGDFLCALVGVYRDGRFTVLSKTSHVNSVGLFYASVTRYLGMKVNEDEHKVMGLAAYERDPRRSSSYARILRGFSIDERLRIRSRRNAHNLDSFVRGAFKDVRFDTVAGVTQAILEDLLVAWVKKAVKQTGIRQVVASGGVFMNVKANMRIAALPEIQRFYVAPSPGDESNAVGAAFIGQLSLRPDAKPEPIRELYLGPDFSRERILSALDPAGKSLEVNELSGSELGDEVAGRLAAGQVVARFDGRMEFGARALGNRSILAHPAHLGVVKEINSRIKSRDFWMPFAPSILRGSEDPYLSSPDPRKVDDQYMMFAFESTDKARRDLSAAMHPFDATVRPQIVDRQWNPGYHDLIERFSSKTGISAVLNTSFNLHRQPIVCSPEDAVDTLLNSGLECLVLGSFLVSKSSR